MAVSRTKKKPASAKKVQEAEYYANEIIEQCEEIFAKGVRSECVEAALKTEQVEKTTISNAKKIVNTFLKKEVI